jgi:hypothetical protein
MTTPPLIDVREVPRIAERLARVGPFQGASAADLEARIWIGAALGIDPGTACANIAFANGRPTFTAGLQAAQLARLGWSVRVDTLTDEVCELTFHRDGKKVGTSRFTLDEAKRAGLLRKDVWTKYPEDLLFARALTRGVRRLVPGLLVGNAAYVREELGADTHEPIPPQAKVTPATGPANGTVTSQQLAELRRLKDALAIKTDAWRAVVRKRGVETARDLTPAQAAELIAKLKARVVADQLEEKMAEDDAARDASLTVAVPVVARKEVEAAAPAEKRS